MNDLHEQFWWEQILVGVWEGGLYHLRTELVNSIRHLAIFRLQFGFISSI